MFLQARNKVVGASSWRLGTLFMVVIAAVSACGKAEVARGINAPYEAHNRAVHEANKSIDRTILRPLAGGSGGIVPEPVMQGISNFAGNVSLPQSFVNDVLQANIDDAAHNFTRFLINTTFGIGGLLDPASAWGLPARDSDFGETLHVWGMAEGHYVELPLLGPSTKRDTLGKAVDIFTNPLSYILPTPEKYAVPASSVMSRIGDRGRFGDTIDSILYDSADSYSQMRLLYLESRRYQLGGEQSEDAYDDYDDFYSN